MTAVLCSLAVLSLLAGGVSAQCATGVNGGVDNCRTEPRLVHINCVRDTPCTCSDSQDETESVGLCSDYPTVENLDSVINYTTADGNKCEELCKAIWEDDSVADIAKKCQYYKFEEVSSET